MNVYGNNKITYNINNDNKTVDLLLDENPIARITIKTKDKASFMIINYANMFGSTEVKMMLNDDIHRSIINGVFKFGSYRVKQMISAYLGDHADADVLYLDAAYADNSYEVLTAYVYDDKINIHIESNEDICYGADIYRINDSEEEFDLYGIYGEFHTSYKISDLKEIGE